MMYLGNILQKRPTFYFSQTRFKNTSYGLKITDNENDEQGLIDTGFEGGLIFPLKYKAVIKQVEEKKYYRFPDGRVMRGFQVLAMMAFFNNEYQEQTIYFAKINRPIMGIEFLKTLKKVTFDFKKEKVTF